MAWRFLKRWQQLEVLFDVCYGHSCFLLSIQLLPERFIRTLLANLFGDFFGRLVGQDVFALLRVVAVSVLVNLEKADQSCRAEFTCEHLQAGASNLILG